MSYQSALFMHYSAHSIWDILNQEKSVRPWCNYKLYISSLIPHRPYLNILILLTISLIITPPQLSQLLNGYPCSQVNDYVHVSQPITIITVFDHSFNLMSLFNKVGLLHSFLTSEECCRQFID